MIDDKKYVFVLCPGFGTELLKPLEFPGIRADTGASCYVSEMTLGSTPQGGAGCWPTSHVVRGLEFSVPLS